MEILTATHTLNKYTDITINDNQFDDTDNAKIVFDVNYYVDVNDNGLIFGIQDISNINLEYDGIFFENDKEDVPVSIGNLDFKIQTEIESKEYNDADRYILSPSEVVVDVINKQIIFNFIY